MITAEISHFSGSYFRLNQKNQELNISKLMLARSVVMVGHQGLISGFNNLGFFRLVQLFCCTLANIETENGYIKLKDSFFNLPPSEKRIASYYLGMGLAKACSEILLDIPWLIHINNQPGVLLSGKANKSPSKVILIDTDETSHEPDLIGYDSLKRPHIFEAKGYSSGMNLYALQHAINQVSQVISVNGKSPQTRVACFYNMSSIPINGRIVDPDDENISETGISITIEFSKFIYNYYSLFFDDDNWFQAEEIRLFERSFKIRSICDQEIFFGIDSEILHSELHSEKILKHISYFVNNFQSINPPDAKNDFSIGLDGTILLTKKGINIYSRNYRNRSSNKNHRFIR